MKGSRFLSLVLVCAAGSALAADVPQLKIEEVAAGSKLSLPLRSEAVLARKGVPALSAEELPALAESDFKVKCAHEAYRATGGTSFLTHHSDIPELDQIMPLMMGSIVETAACPEKPAVTTKAGFVQAAGKIEVQLAKKLSAFESADRRLIHVSLPVVVHSGWSTFETGKTFYRRQCDLLKQSLNAGATVLVACTEPQVEIKCCGNADLVGEVHALVFAYAAKDIVTKTFTAPTPQELALKTDAFLAEERGKLKDKLAFSYCTPPSWEYAPIMAQQAHCYAMMHTFAPLHPTKTLCVGDFSTKDEKGKVYASYKEIDGKAFIRLDAKTDRAYRGWNNAAATLTAEGARQTLTTENLILGWEGAMGNLHGFDTHLKGAPVDISVTCK